MAIMLSRFLQHTTVANNHQDLKRLKRKAQRRSLFIAALALLSALLVRWHYGYLIGREPSVAFLFLLLACKFAESQRRSDARLLICLSAFLLLTQYFYAQGILSAALTLPAVMVLGATLYQLRDPAQTYRISVAMKRVAVLLLQGLPIAAMLFFFFPRLPGPLWGLPDDASASTGLSGSMSPGSISNLSRSNEVAFRVEFDGYIPLPSERYWRGPVLTQFDGRNWTARRQVVPARVAQPQAGKADQDPRHRPVGYTVTLQPSHESWLFALELPASVPRSVTHDGSPGRILGKLTQEQQLLGQPVRETVRYRQYSLLRDHYRNTTSDLIANTQLSHNNPRSQQFAQQLRQRSNDDADYAQRVLQFFHREPFHYTLQPPLLGARPVDEFLFDSLRGFCEHYASAFVVLMRAAGIPSRVVTGYQGGTMNGDYMLVRQSDAHAWAEAWIDGAWRRYDPTAAVAPMRVEQGLEAVVSDAERELLGGSRHTGTLAAWSLRWDALNHQWQRWVIGYDRDQQLTLWRQLGLSPDLSWQIALLILAPIGGWALLLIGWSGRRPKIPQDDRLWRQWCALMQRRGVKINHNEGPQDYGQRLAQQWPQHAQHLQQCAEAFANLRYGPGDTAQLQRCQRLLAASRQLDWSGPTVAA